MSSQEQVGGDHSTNIQGNEVTIIQGTTYSQVREIALDVFKANFYSLAGDAAETARQRAEEITEKVIQRLKAQHTEGFSQAKDPDFQYALFEVQKEYAKVGDEELGALLVDLLVDRTKQEKRTIFQIVLSESIKVAPKLTTGQMAILSVVFFIKYVRVQIIPDLSSFFKWFDENLLPFIPHLTKKSSSYQHLEFCGCVTVPPLISFNLGPHFLKEYPGLFSKGFDPKELVSRAISFECTRPLFTECFHDNSKIQFVSLPKEALRAIAYRFGVPDSDFQQLIALNESKLMSHEEIKNYLIQEKPYFAALFDFWEDSLLHQTTLTSVGMAIGHANIKRNTGKECVDLSTWFK